MKVPLIAGNWKMNRTLAEAKELVEATHPGLHAVDGAEVVLCPPFTALETVHGLIQGSKIGLGAQDMHYEPSGAITGEVSPVMLAELCSHVILGHSERRQLFGETDASVAKKVQAAFGVGLKPILCVGESLHDREGGSADAVVELQVRSCLAGLPFHDELIVAYEPVWAIGTGKAATARDAQAMMGHIRHTLADLYGASDASGIGLLYGGSVTADNVAEFVGEPDVNGALVGGASLKADSFVSLVRNAASAAS